jgi:hypothetical protein
VLRQDVTNKGAGGAPNLRAIVQRDTDRVEVCIHSIPCDIWETSRRLEKYGFPNPGRRRFAIPAMSGCTYTRLSGDLKPFFQAVAAPQCFA